MDDEDYFKILEERFGDYDDRDYYNVQPQPSYLSHEHNPEDFLSGNNSPDNDNEENDDEDEEGYNMKPTKRKRLTTNKNTNSNVINLRTRSKNKSTTIV